MGTNKLAVPQHIAIIMDGNRRWAKQCGLPAALGHASGARRVRSIVQACAERRVRLKMVGDTSQFDARIRGLIRTGGESRISNFMLWQLAYSELFFTDVLWPSFTADVLDQAIVWYGSRERRFGGASTFSDVKVEV